MGYFYGRFIGYLISLVIVAWRVLIEAIQWINEYRKIQKDCENELENQMEILKYKNEKDRNNNQSRNRTSLRSKNQRRNNDGDLSNSNARFGQRSDNASAGVLRMQCCCVGK